MGNALNLDFHGVKMAVMHFMLQFTHVSRQTFWSSQQNEEEKMLRQNCFENVISDFRNSPMCPQNYFKKKEEEEKNQDIHNLWWIVWTN